MRQILPLSRFSLEWQKDGYKDDCLCDVQPWAPPYRKFHFFPVAPPKAALN